MSRSVKKGPFVDEKLFKAVMNVKEAKGRDVIKTWRRACTVVPEFVGMTIAVHDGRKHIPVFVTENMVGHKLGEFAATRTFRMHSGQRQAAKPAGKSSSAAKSSAKQPAAKSAGKSAGAKPAPKKKK